MTTMQTMSRKMHTFAPAFCADAFYAYASTMQSAPTNMMILGAIIMASIIIFANLVVGLILSTQYALLVVLVVVALVHNIIIAKT